MILDSAARVLPKGWKELSLDNACELITDGSHFSPATTETGYPYITVRDLNDSGIDFNNCKYISEKSYEELTKNGCRPQKNDVLFSKDGTVGKVALIETDIQFVVLSSLAILRPTKSLVDSRFLRLAMQSPAVLESALGMKTGTALRRIVLRNLKTVAINVPPLEEQLKIVEILEEQLSRLDAALASVRAVREKSERFRRSLLHVAFIGALTSHERAAGMLPSGWSTVRLGDCLEKLKSGKLVERGWSPQCLSQPSSDEDTWGVLKTTAVQMGDYWAEFNKELPESLEPKTGLEVNDGDFLMTTTGPRNRCGIVCLVNQTRKKLIFSGKILRFRADTSRLMPGWLMYLMMSPDIQKTFDEMKVGTSDSSVSIGNQQVLDLIIPIAPLDEQKKTLEILDAQFSRFEASLALADAIEKKASALRRSLLHAAFSGSLTKEWREGAYV
jgi:restriction endonuclease S subunit